MKKYNTLSELQGAFTEAFIVGAVNAHLKAVDYRARYSKTKRQTEKALRLRVAELEKEVETLTEPTDTEEAEGDGDDMPQHG